MIEYAFIVARLHGGKYRRIFRSSLNLARNVK